MGGLSVQLESKQTQITVQLGDPETNKDGCTKAAAFQAAPAWDGLLPSRRYFMPIFICYTHLTAIALSSLLTNILNISPINKG